MSKVWAWLKKNWKWLILPLWALSLALMWFFSAGRKPVFPPSGTTDQAADEAMKARQQALDDFRARLEEMAKAAQKRLEAASQEQVKEFNELKDKPLDEVTKWIDKIS
jgi:hypothetical protein